MCTHEEYEKEKEVQRLLREELNRIFYEKTEQLQHTLNKFKKESIMRHMKLAFSQYGIREIVGKQDNPEVLKYFQDLGFDASSLKDETAWCSAFVNWVARMSGLDYSKKLNARSWMKIGSPIEGEPQLGDIVVFWRVSKTSWKGHVGFYVNHDEHNIYVLGGNQSNMVCVKPYRKDRLLTYRRLT